jgi:hypothetical protein
MEGVHPSLRDGEREEAIQEAIKCSSPSPMMLYFHPVSDGLQALEVQ